MELRLPGVFQEDIAISSPSLVRAAEAQSTPITQLFLQLQDDKRSGYQEPYQQANSFSSNAGKDCAAAMLQEAAARP